MAENMEQGIALNIRYFGPLTDITQLEQEIIYVEGNISILTLKDNLIKRYKHLDSCPFRFAVDQEMVPEFYIIDRNCEISLFPPFAGG